MRELTKSMLRFSWALPLFGVKQMINLAAPKDWKRPTAQATEAFEAMSHAAQSQLGGVFANAFEMGDHAQRYFINILFSPMDLIKTTSDQGNHQVLHPPLERPTPGQPVTVGTPPSVNGPSPGRDDLGVAAVTPPIATPAPSTPSPGGSSGSDDEKGWGPVPPT